MIVRGLLAALLLTPSIGLLILVTRPGPLRPGEAWILIALFGTLSGLVTWELVQQIRAIGLSRRVKTAGLQRGLRSVCPRCAGDPFGATPCCGRFPRAWTWQTLHDFWHAIALARRQPASTIKNAYQRRCGPERTSVTHPGGGWLGRLLSWTRLGRAMIWPMLAAVILGFAGTLAALVAIRQGATINGPWIWWIVPGALAIGLVLAGRTFLRHRHQTTLADELTTPKCRACGYELHPPWASRCPECGTGLDAWNTVSFAHRHTGEGVNPVLQERWRQDAESA